MRTTLVLIFVVLFVLVLLGMWVGWRHRGVRQADLPPLPAVPEVLSAVGSGLAPQLTGLYIGTTTAFQWQDRIVARTLGERAAATADLRPDGVLIDRQGSDPIFVPDARLIEARIEPAIAGKVIGQGGLLVLRWEHGAGELDTGLRGDDRSVYVPWIKAIAARTGATAEGVEQ